MSHLKLYRKGRISLKKYRRLQGLKLAGRRNKKAKERYEKEEKEFYKGFGKQ